MTAISAIKEYPKSRELPKLLQIINVLCLEQLITTKMVMNGASVPDSFLNVVNFKSGLTWSVSKNLSLDLNVSLGLTEDAPNAVIELRFPYTF